jgi:basic membrane lipoprotein Med (substrate-binding protein (PBP1-ABC) superfamily)
MRRPRFRKAGVIAMLAVTAAFGILASTASTAARQDYKIALLTTGALNNKSWANAWADGANRAKRELGVDVTLVGNMDAPDQYLQQGSAFAAQGYDLIIMAHGAMAEPAGKVAAQFPDVQVIQAPFQLSGANPYGKEPKNLAHIDAEQQFGAFQAGMLAGLITRTNKIGAVYAFPFPALTRQPEGFILGARCVNSQVKFAQKQSGSFTDAAAARAAASSLIAGGADVVFGAVDQAVQGLIQAAAAAKKKPTYAIASYYDSHTLNPKVVLTSVLYGLDKVAYDLIKRGSSGTKWPAHWFKSYGLKDGVGELAPLFQPVKGEVPARVVNELAQLRTRILKGQIKVPDEFTIGAVGSGTKLNPKSIGCTPA